MKRMARIRENLRHCSFAQFQSNLINERWDDNSQSLALLFSFVFGEEREKRERETNPSVSPCMWQKVSTSIHPPHLYSFLDKSILCRARSCKAMLLAESGAFSNDKSLAKPIHLSDLSRWWSTKLKIMYQFYTSLRPLSRAREIFHVLFQRVST